MTFGRSTPDAPHRAPAGRRDAADALDGVLVVDKPAGPTSHDVVARVRRALRLRRVGHTGTLDPPATGVLPLVLGRATRLSRYFTGADKGYEAVIRLGLATDTYDAGGAPLPPPGDRPVSTITRQEIAEALEAFRGTFEQTPPPYSAKKIGGVRAYRLARRQEAATPEPVRVTVSRLEIAAFEDTRLELVVEASAGFYVRSLAHDLGVRLGCGAHLESLRRFRSGEFRLDQAVPLEALEARPELARERLVPIDRLLTRFPGVVLNEGGVRRAAHGNVIRYGDVARLLPSEGPLPGETRWPAVGSSVRLFDPSGALVAIAETRAGRFLHPVVVLV
ncbi:MAG TPA: tRNA pseudouridine(55) synthase TruB [Vicinamibacterales bacterium]|nr:tRNA pseudouridine(55) synthase TruB [Vicinamibacterales bacterium]